MIKDMLVKNSVLKEYQCNGDFSFENEEKVNLNFSIVQYFDGAIQLTAFLDDKQYEQLSTILHKNHCICSIEGKLNDGSGNIFVKSAFLNAIPHNANFHVFSNVNITYSNNSNYNHVKFGLLNFLNNDNYFGDFIDFKCQLKDYPIRFEGIPEYKKFEELLREEIISCALTSYASIYTSTEVREDFEKLTYFLSYINRTPIYFVTEDYYHNDELVKTVLFYGPKKNFSKNIKLIKAENLNPIVEKCFNDFLKYFSEFSLNIVISIFLQGLSCIYSDIGYVLIEISLETFLDKYECYCKDNGENISISIAENNKKTLCEFFTKNNFDITKEDLNQLVDEISPDYSSVMDKFFHLRKNDKFKKNLKHQEGDDYFQTIRNKIAHTGEFPKTIHKDNKEITIGEEFERLVYLIDRIILTLIGFEGSFFKINGGETEL